MGIKLWGLDGAPRMIYSMDELKKLFSDHEALASYILEAGR